LARRSLEGFTLPDPPAEPLPRPGGYPDNLTRAIAEAKAARWFAAEAESIPGVRRALSVIVGTISTFTLAAWKGNARLEPALFPWLAQPDPARTSQAIIAATVRDGIWHDRCVWRRTPGGFYRISPERVIPTPGTDPDLPPAWTLDGRPATAGDELVVFDFAGAGGLRRFGAPLLEMFATLMSAAAKYADEPVPSVILKNTGNDIGDDAIDAILERWETARATRRTGFLNAYLEAQTPGYNARDLQLVEIMDQATKDVARLFGLPGWALGVDTGSSMTYTTVTDQRRDLLEALRPWSSTIEQTLSLDTYAVAMSPAGVTASRRGLFVPYGTDVRFDVADYLRGSFSERVTALVAATGGPIMSTLEARTLEPTITDPAAMDGVAHAPAPVPA
jgi:hypothetical protein